MVSESAVNEIRRILKPGGLARLSVVKGTYSFVGRAEWEEILEGFRVERKGDGFPVIADRWAVVSTRSPRTCRRVVYGSTGLRRTDHKKII
jgi:hypothetical protein